MFFEDEASSSIANSDTGFLALLWREMFNPTTPDTFQPRLFNLPALVREVGDAANRTQRDPRWHFHLTLIQNEIKASLREDAVFLEALPYFAATCERICCLKSYVEIERLAKHLTDFDSDYAAAADHALLTAANQLPKKKNDAERALRRIATVAMARNCLPTRDTNLHSGAYLAKSAPEWAALFIQDLKHSVMHQRVYECILPAFGLTERTIRPMLKFKGDFDLLLRADVPFGIPKEWRPGVFFKITNVSAPNGEEALRLAARRLRPTLDILGFYQPSERPEFGLSGAVKLENGWTVLPVGGRQLRELSPRKHSIQLTRRALSIPHHLLSGRILNALEHYSLAQSNTAFRIKLTNLWSALECLASVSSPGDGVFDKVKETVVPIVIWRRTDKICRYIAAALSQLRRQNLVADLGPHFESAGTITAEEVLLALASNDDASLARLHSAIAGQCLLSNRIFKLGQTFRDPRLLAKDLRESQLRTEWHLARIYRARNLIVHEGEELPVVRHLVDNLQYYLSVTLSRILHRMSATAGTDVTDAIVYWRNRSAYLIETLERAPTKLVVRDFFPRPVRKVHSSIWQ